MTKADQEWDDPNPPDPIDPRTPFILTVAGVVLTAVVVATLIGVVLFAAGDEGSGEGGNVVLVAANAAPPQPFTRSIVVAPVDISPQAAAEAEGLLAQVPIRASRGLRLVFGRQPGLYGGTGQTLPCDAVTLANDLDAQPELAQVWGLALGMTPRQLPYYLNSLTAVVLMADTWVTIHTLNDGVTDAQQAVLQARTAVLIDRLGVPRVVCASGAPLTPPANDTLAEYRPSGDEWPGFSPHAVVAVDYAHADDHPADQFDLIDVGTGERLSRHAGGVIALAGDPVPLPDPALMNVPPGPRESGDR